MGTECFVCQRIRGPCVMCVGALKGKRLGARALHLGPSTDLAEWTWPPEPLFCFAEGPQGHGEGWAGWRLRVHAPTGGGGCFHPGCGGRGTPVTLQPGRSELMPLPSKPCRRPRDCGGSKVPICILRSSGKWVSTACVEEVSVGCRLRGVCLPFHPRKF